MLDKVLKFIGSKWFSLGIAIVCGLALPATWYNVTVYRVWWTMAVFGCNLGAVGLGCYKFVSALQKKPQPSQTKEEW